MLALVLAFVTWLYIGEVAKVDTRQTVLQKLLSRVHYVSKKLYVKPNFVGRVPNGYILLEDQVKVEPEFIVVVGPSKMLSKEDFIYTESIDLGEHTKTKSIEVGLQSISRWIRFQKAEVQVYLPVAKNNSKRAEE